MELTEKIILLSIGLLLIIFIAVKSFNKTDRLKQLRERYEKALQGTDKEEALSAGRAYYSFLRGGEHSNYDDAVINHEIASMPEKED